MCCIAGILSFEVIAESHLIGMARVQAHRGPDGEGVWLSPDGRLGMAHRRLSILDLSERGAQPMVDPVSGSVIVHNGEIYNYVELREDLRRAGHAFETETDTEVILAAYREWGPACLDRFNGMFAFALYDARRRILFCARDRFGEKPFLFTATPGTDGAPRFAFASEYKALLALPWMTSDVDVFRVLRGLHNASTGLDADRQTVFANIRQLLPGEAMEVDTATLRQRVWRYWDVDPMKPDYSTLSEKDAFEKFRSLLIDAVRLRLRSDVPVGSCLSGGLDSGAIVSIVRRYLLPDGEYHTFTGRFPGTSADEWHYASVIAERNRVTPHVVEPKADDFVKELPEFMWYNELPVGSSSQYAQWCVFRLAAHHGVTVLLDGQGADELLGGYEQYFAFYLEALREAGNHETAAREEAAIRQRYPLALPSGRGERLARIPLSLRHRIATFAGRGSSFLFGVSGDVARQLATVNARVRDGRFHALSSALYQDSFGMYLTALLRYGDRNSMAHSREVRLPFCDHRLAEFALSQPPGILLGNAQTKRLLRESMRGILDETVRTRWNKQGFRPPQQDWFRGDLLALAEAVIEDTSFSGDPVWNIRWWRSLLKRIRHGESHLAWTLWQPLMYASWKRHFVDRADALRRAVGRDA